MLTKLIVLTCLIVGISCTSEKISNKDYVDRSVTGESNEEEDIIIRFENRMNNLFSIWKIETNRKLDTLEQMIPHMEENINEKLYILRNSMVVKLEEYIDSKLYNLERNIAEKLNKNVNCNCDVLDKKTFETFEKNINLKFEALALPRNNSEILEGSCNPDVTKKVTDLEEILNNKLEVLDKKIPLKLEEKLSTKIDALAKNISEKFEGSINCTSDTKTKRNKPPQPTGNESNATSDEFDGLSTSDSSENNGIELACLVKESLSHKRRESLYYSMDNEAFKHVIVERDSAGLLTYLAMHVAIQADKFVNIFLLNNSTYWESEIRYNINIGCDFKNKYTCLEYQDSRVQLIQTPGILSPTEFRTFYIQVDNGTLQFGKVGDSEHLIARYDDGFRSFNYFQFFYGTVNEATIGFDCPVPAGYSDRVLAHL